MGIKENKSETISLALLVINALVMANLRCKRRQVMEKQDNSAERDGERINCANLGGDA